MVKSVLKIKKTVSAYFVKTIQETIQSPQGGGGNEMRGGCEREGEEIDKQAEKGREHVNGRW